jgi:peptidoglycan/LPS O-acetylase OafA/YrhL
VTSPLRAPCDEIASISAPVITAPRSVAPPSGAARSRYLPGLDGLRAVAVVAVLLYHAQVSWLPGGFLGVDVFFVISGYLITMLLLQEHQRSGRIGVRRFYARRARRLLPALYLLLVTSCVVVAIWFRDEAARLRPQVLSALTYSTNWYLIATDGSYFERLGRPLLLRHLWSLAVEEQFYLLWPLALVVLLRRFRGRLGPMALAVGALATASAIWMAVLYEPGQDPSRLYYGTDTRISTLLIGALLALFWRPSALAHGGVRRHGALFDAIGVAALGGIVLFFVRSTDASGSLYRGGFVALAVVSALAVAAVAHPATYLGRVLGVGALTWIGVRSYALYLWHWPVFVLTRPDLDVPLHGWPLLAVRLGLTVVLADLSYRLVERPIRRIGLRAWTRRTLHVGPAGRRRPAVAVVLAGAIVGASGVVAVMRSGAQPVSDIELSLRAGEQAIAAASSAGTTTAPTTGTIAVTLPPQPVTVVDDTARAVTTAVAVGTTPPTEPTTTVPPTTPAPTAPPPAVAPAVGPIVALGDSVMLGAAPQLLATFGPGTVVDAQVSRTLWPVIGLLASMKAEGRLGSPVVLHFGDNGGVDPNLIAQAMASLTDVPRVLWINVKVPRSWEARVNETLAAEIPKYPNARLLDWKGIATDPSFFYEDGIHLRPAGAAFFAQAIKDALAQP